MLPIYALGRCLNEMRSTHVRERVLPGHERERARRAPVLGDLAELYVLVPGGFTVTNGHGHGWNIGTHAGAQFALTPGFAFSQLLSISEVSSVREYTSGAQRSARRSATRAPPSSRLSPSSPMSTSTKSHAFPEIDTSAGLSLAKKSASGPLGD